MRRSSSVPAATIASGDPRVDERTFADLTSRHRRELHVHCYRMLSSFDDAEDAVQETFLRAWRSRDSFDGSTMFRAWLYKIATNVCLDVLRSRSRRLTTMRTFDSTASRPLRPLPVASSGPSVLNDGKTPQSERIASGQGRRVREALRRRRAPERGGHRASALTVGWRRR